MNETRYLLDNVTLSRLSPAQRTSAFIMRTARIPSEVLYEARGLAEIAALSELEYEPTLAVLENVRKTLMTLMPTDKLVDLYKNEGNGDVMLIASALTLMMAEDDLFPDRWIIATDDGGLSAKAGDLGIQTCTTADLRARIDEVGVGQ